MTADIPADCYAGTRGPISLTPSGDTDPGGVDDNQIPRLASGDWLEYPNVDFGSGASQFDARVASGAGHGISGLVEVVLDNPDNPPIGSFAVASTGGWGSWRTIPADIAATTGIHTVYLLFSSVAANDPPYVSIHYFAFPAS